MKVKLLLTMFAFLLVASPIFAQTQGSAGNAVNWVAITSGFSMAISSGICGLAQGKAVAAAVEGMARNPSAAGAIRMSLIIGLALIESLVLYTLLIVFLKVV
jgi:F-type H+-transporting ATPase subunit c